jgi:hypothetical protein
MLPEDTAARAAAHGSTYMAVMFPPADAAAPPRQEIINNFKSKDDVVDAIAASCYTPLWAGPNITTT